MNGFSALWPVKIAPGGMLWPIWASRAAFGFSSNATIWRRW
jgi:hypothetical protein